MLSRFSHFFFFVLIAAVIISGCKSGTTEPGTTTPHINIGDTVPTKGAGFFYTKSYLDANGNIIIGSSIARISAIIDTSGQTILGKNNVYVVSDDGDSSYYSYEANSDVSIYLINPGFLWNYSGGYIDETLQTVLNFVFHNWITLPIASKATGITAYSKLDTVTISAEKVPTNITANVDYIADSTIILNKDTLIAKECRISITAVMTLGTNQLTLTHVRNIWFVPKIGYIAKISARTNMPAIPVYVVPLDTTATLKVLTSYQFK